MSDALNKNVPVYPAVYCEDEQGNPDSTTAMYPWCHIRAAGPNCLKDTTLCGITSISEPSEICLVNKPDGIEPFYYCWLTDSVGIPVAPNIAVEIPMSDTTNPALDGAPYQQEQWYPFGLKVCSNGIDVPPTNPPVNWSVAYQLNSDCQAPTEAGTVECLQKKCPGLTFPLINYDFANTLQHRILAKNVSGVKLICHVFLNCTVDLTATVNPANYVGVQLGVGKIDKTTTIVTPDDVFQNSTTNFAFSTTGSAYRYATDFICEIDNDEVIVPVWRFLTDIEQTENNALVWQTCGLTVQVVGFCDDTLPASQIIPPPSAPPT